MIYKLQEPLHLIFDGFVQLGNILYVEDMHISANMRPKIRIKGQFIFSSKFVTPLDVTRGRGINTKDN